MRDDDEFWLDVVRATGSNMAVDGFATLEAAIENGTLDEHMLRRLHGALRSMSQRAWDKAALLEARKKRPWERSN